jgi:hypothetical protein
VGADYLIKNPYKGNRTHWIFRKNKTRSGKIDIWLADWVDWMDIYVRLERELGPLAYFSSVPDTSKPAISAQEIELFLTLERNLTWMDAFRREVAVAADDFVETAEAAAIVVPVMPDPLIVTYEVDGGYGERLQAAFAFPVVPAVSLAPLFGDREHFRFSSRLTPV